MAIITDIQTERGYTYRQQYCRIENIDVSKLRMRIDMGIYESIQHAENDEFPHRSEIVYGDFNLESELNLWQQGYAIIKAKWPDSVDI